MAAAAELAPRIALGLILVGACDPPRSGPAPSRSATAVASATATAVATATASAAAKSAFAGSWRGAYDAKRAAVTVPSADPWPAWQKDDDKRVGRGDLALEVDDAGFVSGEAAGALGELRLRGRIEDGALRAGATPAHPDDEAAMTGTLTGKAEAAAIHAVLRVASEDGERVRVSEVTLERAK